MDLLKGVCKEKRKYNAKYYYSLTFYAMNLVSRCAFAPLAYSNKATTDSNKQHYKSESFIKNKIYQLLKLFMLFSNFFDKLITLF